jgi:hypothetical protein
MIGVRKGLVHTEHAAHLSKKTKATCNDCYFRCAGLCALPGDAICPTFRMQAAGLLAPPPQPQLVARPLAAASAA